MKIVCISDLHNLYKNIDIPDGDVVLCSGDMTNRGKSSEIRTFCQWYSELPHKHKIFICGNHDWLGEKNPSLLKEYAKEYGLVYLCDSEYVVSGLKIWGSPHTPRFCDWAFNQERTLEEAIQRKRLGMRGNFIKDYWDMILSDTDILITHGPPYGILDSCYGRNVGCSELLKACERIKPKYHLFGHIHEGYGTKIENGVVYINASICDGMYKPVNQPVVFEV